MNRQASFKGPLDLFRDDIGAATDAVSSLRLRGLDVFEASGVPSTSDETWRYTNLKSLAKHDFALPGRTDVVVAERSLLGFGTMEAFHAICVDGRLDKAMSSLEGLPDGLSVLSLKEAIEVHGDSVISRLGALAPCEDEAMVALNTAGLRDAVVVHVARGQAIDKPLHLGFFSASAEVAELCQPRILIILEEGAELTLLESYCGLGDGTYLNNAVGEICVGSNASLKHLKVQDEAGGATHIQTLVVKQQRDSRYYSFNASFGASIARTSLTTRLSGEGAECILDGVYLAAERQHADVTTIIDHAVPHCTSKEYYKGVLADKASSIFHGHVLVREKAQKTDSAQHNKNLLLSKGAVANTRPQLEIYADDVKCAHGSTVGQLDEDQIFYLRARGIPKAEAKRELTFAFAGEVLERMDEGPIRDHLQLLIRERLEAI